MTGYRSRVDRRKFLVAAAAAHVRWGSRAPEKLCELADERVEDDEPDE